MGFGEQLRSARKAAGLTLRQVADEVGCASSTLANIEGEVSSPSDDLRERIIKKLGINREWINTGKGPIFKVSVHLENDPYPVLPTHILIKLNRLRESEQANTARRQELQEFGVPISVTTPNTQLTDRTEKRIVDPLNSPTLQDLLLRLKTATAPRGKKTELAKHLGVKPQRVHEWLRGEAEPGGDVTLRMFQWVKDEEDKQKNPTKLK